MIIDIFRENRRFNSSDKQQLHRFFLSNQFFSKIYEHKYFDQISQMTHYFKINANQTLTLDNDKRSEAVILLQGNIQIFKKNLVPEYKKPSKYVTQYLPLIQFSQFSQTILLNAECKITATKDSHILFIPVQLFHIYRTQRQSFKLQEVYNAIFLYYPEALKKHINSLAQGCYFKEYKMGSFIYRVCDKPQNVYILSQGNIRIDFYKTNESSLKSNSKLIGANMMFGDTDINLNQRQTSTLASAAYTRVLILPKIPFLKFAKIYHPQILQNQSISSPRNLKSKNVILPYLKYSSNKNEQTENYKYINKGHRYLDFGENRYQIKRKRNSLSQSNDKPQRQKLKLLNQIRPLRYAQLQLSKFY